jgi:hypothetical protein
MSLPFCPARMNASPVHLITAYDEENARPLNASDANIGAPLLIQVLYSTPKLAVEQASSDHASALLSWPVVKVDIFGSRS